MRVADYIIQYLADLGTQHIFLLPGGGAMHLNDAVACNPDVDAVICHHEQACGIAAEAYGRSAAAGFGVAMVTTGPGATNVITPVAGAWIESLPLFVVSGQVKRADSLAGRKIRQGGVQEVDIVALVRPITKFVATLNDPTDVKTLLDRAVWSMRDGRPGPVWIEVPLDVQAAQIDPQKLEGWMPENARSGTDVFTCLGHLKELLGTARRPLILAGHGVRIAGAQPLFQKFVERLGAPATFTWNACDLLPWDHPLYVGRPGVVASRAPNFAIQNCDLLISIGCRLDNIITAYNPLGFARAAKKVVVDVDINELDRHEMKVDLPILADARDFINAFLQDDQFQCSVSDSWVSKCNDWKKRYPIPEGTVTESVGIMSHYEFVDCLSNLLPPDTNVITGSSGLAVEVFYTAFRNRVGQRLFLTSGLGAMGYGVAAAVGCCIGSGLRPTYCIESDGSLMMNLQELATLRSLELPITVVVMNNGGYASIRNTQRNYFDSRFIGTDEASGLFMPDLTDVARCFGFDAVEVQNPAELTSALSGQFPSRPRLINVVLSRDEILAPKVSAIPQKDGSIISMPLEDMSPLLSIEALEREMLIPLTDQSIKSRF